MMLRNYHVHSIKTNLHTMFTCSFTSISLIVMECNTSNINGTSLLLKFKFKKLKGKNYRVLTIQRNLKIKL